MPPPECIVAGPITQTRGMDRKDRRRSKRKNCRVSGSAVCLPANQGRGGSPNMRIQPYGQICKRVTKTNWSEPKLRPDCSTLYLPIRRKPQQILQLACKRGGLAEAGAPTSP